MGSAPVAPTRAPNRFEVKYLVPTIQVPRLIGELSPYLKRDRNAGAMGGYRVLSVYWDTPAHLFFWEKIEGVKRRRKLRFRRYDGTGPIHVEVKQREDRTLQKRRLAWSPRQVQAVFGDGRWGVCWDAIGDDPVAREVAVMIERLKLRPTIAVQYRRLALVGRFDPAFRLTFDGRIQYAPAPTSIVKGFDVGRYVVDPRVTVMEVKYDHRVSSWLSRTITRNGLEIVRMSKYCSAVDRHYYDAANT